MAPKLKLRKESKGKEKATSSNPPRFYSVDSKLNRFFPTQQQHKWYIDYFLPKLFFGTRYVDLGSFPYLCFKFPKDLRRQKIDGLVSMHGIYYLELVKVFYTNMTYEHGVISSSVKGISINFYVVELGQILDIPSKGLEIRMNMYVLLP